MPKEARCGVAAPAAVAVGLGVGTGVEFGSGLGVDGEGELVGWAALLPFAPTERGELAMIPFVEELTPELTGWLAGEVGEPVVQAAVPALVVTLICSPWLAGGTGAALSAFTPSSRSSVLLVERRTCSRSEKSGPRPLEWCKSRGL